MCGRYATTRSDADLSLLFDAVNVTEGLEPSWNVAPTDPVPLVRISQRHGGRVLAVARWGLVPPWARPRGGARMINARAETVATSPAFAPSFAEPPLPGPGRRLVRVGPHRQGQAGVLHDPGAGLAAGLRGHLAMWGNETLLTCSVLTTARSATWPRCTTGCR